MKLLAAYLFFVFFVSISAFAEECIFDENAFFKFRSDYIKNNKNSSLSEDGKVLLVLRGSEKIKITGGGCNHLGISIRLKGSELYTEKQFLEKTQYLAEEFGGWLINIDELKKSIQRRRWKNYEGNYFIEIDVMTVFSASNNKQGEISVDFYIN